MSLCQVRLVIGFSSWSGERPSCYSEAATTSHCCPQEPMFVRGHSSVRSLKAGEARRPCPQQPCHQSAAMPTTHCGHCVGGKRYLWARSVSLERSSAKTLMVLISGCHCSGATTNQGRSLRSTASTTSA